MRPLRIILVFVALALDPFLTFGQNECPTPDITESFEVIFGADNLNKYGRDTIFLKENSKVIYSCWDCNIFLVNSENRIVWTIDLSNIGCRLHSLIKVGLDGEIRGYDILFAPLGNEYYGLNSNNGKYGKIPSRVIRRLNKKPKSKK